MLTTNKDFEGLPTNNRPDTYYCDYGETKPTNNVMNGAVLIEFGQTSGIKVYMFQKSSLTWKEL